MDNDCSAAFSWGGSSLYHPLTPWDLACQIGVLLVPNFAFQALTIPLLLKIPFLNHKLFDCATCCLSLLQSSTEPLFALTCSLMLLMGGVLALFHSLSSPAPTISSYDFITTWMILQFLDSYLASCLPSDFNNVPAWLHFGPCHMYTSNPSIIAISSTLFSKYYLLSFSSLSLTVSLQQCC